MRKTVLLLVVVALLGAMAVESMGQIWTEDTIKCGIFALQCGGRAFAARTKGPAPFAGTVRTERELEICSRKISGLGQLTRR